MLTTLSELDGAVQQWLTDTSGREVVQANYDETHVPKAPYCSFRFNDRNELGSPVAELSEDGLTESISAMYEFKINIKLTGGDNASEVLSRIIASASSALRHFDLWDISGFGGFTPVLDLTQLETGRFRQRFETTLTLYATIQFEFTGEFHETFDLTINETDIGLVHSGTQPVDKLAGC